MDFFNDLMRLCEFPDEYLFEEEEPVVVEEGASKPSAQSYYFPTIPQDDWQRFNDPLALSTPWFALEYADEVKAKQQRIHRYSRVARFKFTLYQLLGMSGDVDNSIILIVMGDPRLQTSPPKIWNSVRSILKSHKLRKYYNRIPYIIRRVAGLKITGITGRKLTAIMAQFLKISWQFDNGKRKDWNLSYFLNMRFVAVCLMKRFDIIYPYAVPSARTARKRRYLTLLFDEFELNVTEEDFIF